MDLFRSYIATAPLARLFAIAFVFAFTSHYPLATNHYLYAAQWTETSDAGFADGLFNMTITSGTGAAAQIVLSPFGTGADGSVTISATKNINADTISGGRTYADGINYAISSIYISSVQCSATPNGIVAGDEIILMNMQGCTTDYGNVGNYEFLRVKEVSGSNLVFNSDVLKIYGSTYTQTNSNLLNQKIVAQRVPNWGNVTINSPGILTCSAWDGTKGGMVVFRSTGTVSVGSGASVDVSTKGFRGGTPATDASGTGFAGAEDIKGRITTGGSDGGSATLTVGGNGGNASGSGGTGGNGGDDPLAGNQAGTGNRGGGGGGATGGNHHAGSGGGGCYDSGLNYSDGSKLTLGGGSAVGGGGGAGAGHGAGTNCPAGGKANGYGAIGTSNGSGDTGGNGGRGGAGNCGGGLVIIHVSTLTGQGSIKSVGGVGGSGGGGGGSGHGGGGGGGGGGANGAAGGTIFVSYNFFGWSGTVNVSAGTGGGGGGGGAGTDWDMQSRNAGGGGGAGAGGGGGGGAEGGSYSQSGHGGNAGSNGSKGVGASAENGGVAPGGGGTMYSNQVGGAANNGGAGAPNGNNASGMNGGAGGNGSSMGGGGGGGGQGAVGASGYSSISSAGSIYYSPATYRSNILDTGVTGSKFTQVSWNPPSQPAGTNLAVGIRVSSYSFSIGSSTPSWTPVTNGGNPGLTGRYIQWMSTFTTTISSVTPRLEDLTIVYNSSPVAPGIGLVSGDTYNKITWRWTYPSSEPQPTNFKIYTSTDGLIATLEADNTYYTESGLKRNKEYSRYIQAYNAISSSNSATLTWRTKPGAFQSKVSQGQPTRTGPNAFGFVGDAKWEWDVPVKAGSALTITAYIRYNSDYGAGTKPKLTLFGKGITPTSISATAAAEDAWELLTLNPGTPSQNATLTLKAEGFSNSPGAKFYIDDINISQ